MPRSDPLPVLTAHLEEVAACRRCPDMIRPVITPRPVPDPAAKVYLVGQAPGPHEAKVMRPFGWTAGRTLFAWFARLGVDEETFRARAFIAAVCRCFPGKTKAGGGDRVPSAAEIENCAPWMAREIAMLRPRLVIPVGKLAIERFLPKAPLAELIGGRHVIRPFGHECDAIPLPHPSGASTWFKTEPGRTLLEKALRRLSRHPAWRALTT